MSTFVKRTTLASMLIAVGLLTSPMVSAETVTVEVVPE